MKQAIVRNVAAVAALAAGLCSAELRAASWMTCNDVPVRPYFYGISWHVNGCSISSFDSPEGRSVVRATGELGTFWRPWGTTAATPDPTEACVIHHRNDEWEVALVDPGAIDGAAGLTLTMKDGCNFSWEEEHIDESDVMIAVNQNFNEPDGLSWLRNDSDPGAGRIAMLHEFGHAYGLEHSSGFSVMRPTNFELPFGGSNQSGSHVYFMGDDAAGMQNLIGVPGGVPNAYVSAQMLLNGSMANVNSDPVSQQEIGTPKFVRAGDSVSFFISVGSTTWDSRMPFDVRIYADDPTQSCTPLDGVGTELLRLRGAVGGFSTVTQAVTVVIPASIPRNQNLRVFVGIDPRNELFATTNTLKREKRAWDNCASTGLILNVKQF